MKGKGVRDGEANERVRIIKVETIYIPFNLLNYDHEIFIIFRAL